jgi:hypothetical protein
VTTNETEVDYGKQTPGRTEDGVVIS